jgi:TM2 domain-containing membrane protein YozV
MLVKSLNFLLALVIIFPIASKTGESKILKDNQASSSFYLEQKIKDYQARNIKNSLLAYEGFSTEEEGKKSTSKALLLSFLIPGSGQLYAGAQTKGEIFLGTEASLWLGLFAFRTYGSWIKNDYKGYAATHANVDLHGKSDNYFKDIAFYMNRDEYNQFIRLFEGMNKALYLGDEWNWEWDSQKSLDHYRDLRDRERAMYRRALYMVGLSLINRVVSAVDAVREVKKFNRKKVFDLSSVKFDLKAHLLGKNPSFFLALYRSF